jgi:hypothetical protein
VNEQVQQVIDAVKNAAPVMWQAAYRQVFIDGFENFLLMVIFLIFARRLYLVGSRYVANDKYPDWGDPIPALCITGTIIATLVSLPFLVCGIDCFANPTFQAIKNLAALAKH